jgi:oligopeptide/dipeptide ABC transporter ATP-binding protein
LMLTADDRPPTTDGRLGRWSAVGRHPSSIIRHKERKTMTSEPLLKVKDLKAYFPLDEGLVKAVDGVSFDVFPGQVLGIVGESGCGKSVTMKAILQIIEPPGRVVAGEILLAPRSQDGGGDGASVDLAKLKPNSNEMRNIRGADIALIPQEPMSSFSPVHSIGSQIIEAIMLHQSVKKDEARTIAVDLLHSVGIPMPEQRIDAYSWQLSGGLRQRAIIAMALSCHPRLLIADEPTTAIDVTTQAQILNLLRALQRERDTAIIFITHDLGVIAQMANDVVVMYLGRVMEKGPVSDIFLSPKHPYTQALLNSIPSMSSTPRVKLPIISGSIPHPFNRPPGCPFHPRCQDFIAGRCDQRIPSLQPVGENQFTSCFLYHDAEEKPEALEVASL